MERSLKNIIVVAHNKTAKQEESYKVIDFGEVRSYAGDSMEILVKLKEAGDLAGAVVYLLDGGEYEDRVYNLHELLTADVGAIYFDYTVNGTYRPLEAIHMHIRNEIPVRALIFEGELFEHSNDFFSLLRKLFEKTIVRHIPEALAHYVD